MKETAEKTPEELAYQEIAARVEEVRGRKFVPLFEWYVTMFSVIFSVALFVFPDFLQFTGSNTTNLYEIMLNLMPQHMWAFAFLIAGLVKSVGLLIKNTPMRTLGLVLSVFLYLIMTICYSVNFPAIGSIVFGLMTLFSGISVMIVKHTG
ncbi:hypothetical protein [Bhargavaea ginsengi]|uniref:hypothetical protein n=1 Tax=Bhargavaea ginsengi TaxID=426757 RepID=UPI003C7906A1